MRHLRLLSDLPVIFSTLMLLAGTVARAGGDPTGGQTGPATREDARTWTSGHTSVSDRSWDEFKRSLTFRLPADYATRPKVDMSRTLNKAAPLPTYWDWRRKNEVTPVKDQGQCGSCWAFASVGALEAGALLNDGVVYDLSEQQVLSCNNLGDGCGGGDFDAAFDVFHRLGAVSEDCMPYLGLDGINCSYTCRPQVMADSMIQLDTSVESIKAAVYTYGPVACGLAVLPDFMSYTSGCYNDRTTMGEVNHAVVIVGWDDLVCSGGAWICKNSWGTGWGDMGFFEIGYGCCSIGDGAVVFVADPQNVVEIDPVPVNTRTQTGGQITLQAQVVSNTNVPVNQDSVKVTYRVNGGAWNPLPLRADKDAGVYETQIDAPPKPATVDYYFTACDQNHHSSRSPSAPQNATYSFDVARIWDDFEGDVSGWTVGGPEDTATNGIWVCVAPIGSDSKPSSNHTPGGSKCWMTGQGKPGEDDDVDGGQTTLTSPIYDLSGSKSAWVKYWRWYSNNRGMNPSSDPWVTQVRRIGGPWVDLERTYQSSNRWEQVSVDLQQVLGPNLELVQFRFIASDNPPPSLVGAALDDFELLAEDPPPGKPVWMSPYALVHGPELQIPYVSGVASEAQVFDVTGREIRRIPMNSGSGEIKVLVWDERDATGKAVPSGVYFYSMGRGKDLRQGRVVVVR